MIVVIGVWYIHNHNHIKTIFNWKTIFLAFFGQVGTVGYRHLEKRAAILAFIFIFFLNTIPFFVLCSNIEKWLLVSVLVELHWCETNKFNFLLYAQFSCKFMQTKTNIINFRLIFQFDFECHFQYYRKLNENFFPNLQSEWCTNPDAMIFIVQNDLPCWLCLELFFRFSV